MNSLKQDIQKLRAYEAAHSYAESKTYAFFRANIYSKD